MANAHRGEVDLQVGETTYRLALTFNAMAELEDRTGLGVEAIFADSGKRPMLAARRLVWAALQEHHAEAAPDEKAAGRIIQEAGLETALEAVQKLAGVTVEEKPSRGNLRRAKG